MIASLNAAASVQSPETLSIRCLPSLRRMDSARLCRSLGKLRSTALGEIAESKRLAFSNHGIYPFYRRRLTICGNVRASFALSPACIFRTCFQRSRPPCAFIARFNRSFIAISPIQSILVTQWDLRW